jgi:hypothetical protein
MTRCGLPHSDIFGSKLVCSSPKLFAACHVLHRLLAPRHSPYTLSSLTIKLRTDAHQSFACQLVCDSSFLNTARVCGRKKLPCAEYSVVKDQPCRNSAGNLLTSVGSARHSRSAQRPSRRRCARDSTASFAHRNFSKSSLNKTPRHRDRSYPRNFQTARHSPARGEGWWRIPGSNR